MKSGFCVSINFGIISPIVLETHHQLFHHQKSRSEISFERIIGFAMRRKREHLF
jgi:hypothetical protein